MQNMRIGDEVSFNFGFGGLFQHVGICAGFEPISGTPLIAHNSAKFGEVKISLLSEFAHGKRISVRAHKSDRQPWHISQAITGLIGKRYDALRYNCEHFVSEALGYRAHSPQLVLWAGLGLLFGAALVAAASRR